MSCLCKAGVCPPADQRFRIRHHTGSSRKVQDQQWLRPNAPEATYNSVHNTDQHSCVELPLDAVKLTLANKALKAGTSSSLVPPMSSWLCMPAILASSCRFSSFSARNSLLRASRAVRAASLSASARRFCSSTCELHRGQTLKHTSKLWLSWHALGSSLVTGSWQKCRF
jgi:hypothetical protein